MAQKCLDEADVRAILEHVSGAGVAQQMARASGQEASRTQVPLHHVAEAILGEGLAVIGQEGDRAVQPGDGERRTHFRQIAIDPAGCARAQGQDAVAPSLSRAHFERQRAKIHVCEFQSRELGAPDARGIQRFEDGSVADARERRDISLRQDSVDLLLGRHTRGQPPHLPREYQPRAWICSHEPLPCQPAAKCDDRVQARGLRRGGDRLPVALQVGGKAILVGFKGRMRDLSVLLDPRSRAPARKASERMVANPRRFRGQPDGNRPIYEIATRSGERVLGRRSLGGTGSGSSALGSEHCRHPLNPIAARGTFGSQVGSGDFHVGGKHYNYFRDFDPSIGRYIESDPLGLAGGINTYAYVYSKPLSLVDRDGLVAGPAGEPDPDYRWKPDPRDWYPEPAPDGKCMLLCIVLKTALGTGLGEAARGGGNFMRESPNAGYRIAGAGTAFIANAVGRTPAGQIGGAGVTMAGCEALCRKPKYCEIPSWAQPYQNMPLTNMPFPR